MVFGWQGFYLELPNDFCPVALTGSVQSGYASLAGEGNRSFQVRWLLPRRGTTLDASVAAYLQRLESEAKRKRVAFQSSITSHRYRISGAMPAQGCWIEGNNRHFILEASGSKASSVLDAALKTLRETCGRHRWSINGIDVRLPGAFILDRSRFHAGKTELTFRMERKVGRLRVQRWAFASRLLEGSTLEGWALSTNDWARAKAVCEGHGVRLKPRKGQAIAHYASDLDRILLISATRNGLEWRPEWDWIVSEGGCLEPESQTQVV